MPNVTIIGAGLAGSEAAWQAAELGCLFSLEKSRASGHAPRLPRLLVAPLLAMGGC